VRAPKLFCHVEKKTTAFCHPLAKILQKSAIFLQNKILMRTAQPVLKGRGCLKSGYWILVGNLGGAGTWLWGFQFW
jgi:hypothetical protein